MGPWSNVGGGPTIHLLYISPNPAQNVGGLGPPSPLGDYIPGNTNDIQTFLQSNKKISSKCQQRMVDGKEYVEVFPIYP